MLAEIYQDASPTRKPRNGNFQHDTASPGRNGAGCAGSAGLAARRQPGSRCIGDHSGLEHLDGDVEWFYPDARHRPLLQWERPAARHWRGQLPLPDCVCCEPPCSSASHPNIRCSPLACAVPYCTSTTAPDCWTLHPRKTRIIGHAAYRRACVTLGAKGQPLPASMRLGVRIGQGTGSRHNWFQQGCLAQIVHRNLHGARAPKVGSRRRTQCRPSRAQDTGHVE
jgi:hypothetical protein